MDTPTLVAVGAGVIGTLVILRYTLFPVLIRTWWAKKMELYNSIPYPGLEEAIGVSNTTPNLGSFLFPLSQRLAAVQSLPNKGIMYKDRFLWKPTVASTEPKHLTMVSKMNRTIRFKKIAMFLGRESILFQDGERGKHDRMKLNKAFGTNDFERMQPMMVEASVWMRDRFLKSQMENGYVNPSVLVKRTTLEVICEGGFGYRIQDNSNAAADEITKLLEIALNPLAFFDWGMPLVQWYHRKTLKFVDDLISEIVKQRLASPDESKKDLLQLLVSVEGDMVGGVPKAVWIRDQLQLFCFAGTDTSSATLQWLICFLATNQAVQNKIHEELDEVIGQGYSSPTYQQVSKLKYLEACIKETLRLYPPAAGISRAFAEDQKREIDGVPIPEDVFVRIDIINMHRRADLFSRPNEFLPERFLHNGEDPNAPTVTNDAYVPFAFGFRSCIGKHFAMLEIKTVAATLLKNHRLLPLNPDQPFPDGSFRKGILFPATSFDVKIVDRA